MCLVSHAHLDQPPLPPHSGLLEAALVGLLVRYQFDWTSENYSWIIDTEVIPQEYIELP